MRARYGVAAVFAAAIALVLVLRHEGYLHGRVEGGPLTLSASGVGATIDPRQTAAFGLDVIVEGDPVQVQSVKGEFTSPGLQLLGPRRAEDPCGVCVYRHWPPPHTAPLRAGKVGAGTTETLLGARAVLPGIYYVRNLVALYKRGAKSYRRTYGRDLCVVVTRHRRDLRCPFRFTPPATALIAEAGGPSRYETPVAAGVTAERGQATYPARASTVPIALTLSNLTDNGYQVEGLQGLLELDGAEIGVRQVRPARLFIGPNEGRRVRFEITVEGCAATPGQVATIEELTGQVGAGEDTVPLSVALAFRAPKNCR